jgi:hypothetical protein
MTSSQFLFTKDEPSMHNWALLCQEFLIHCWMSGMLCTVIPGTSLVFQSSSCVLQNWAQTILFRWPHWYKLARVCSDDQRPHNWSLWTRNTIVPDFNSSDLIWVCRLNDCFIYSTVLSYFANEAVATTYLYECFCLPVSVVHDTYKGQSKSSQNGRIAL